jgi:hypothetical protein
MKSWHALVIKWHLAADQHVEHNAKAPNINLGPRVGSGLQQLGSSKIQATAEGLEVATWSKQVAQAKINDLDIARLADEYVLNLEVAVDDAISVAIVEGTCNLPTELAGLLLLQLSVRDDVVQHLAPVDKLEQHVPVVVGPDDVFQAADMRVVKECHDGSLSCSSNLLGLVCPLLVGSTVVAIVG